MVLVLVLALAAAERPPEAGRNADVAAAAGAAVANVTASAVDAVTFAVAPARKGAGPVARFFHELSSGVRAWLAKPGNVEKAGTLMTACAFTWFVYQLTRIELDAAASARREGILLTADRSALGPGAASKPQSLGPGGRELPELTEEERALLGALVDTASLGTAFENIGGLEEQKSALEELVVYPMRVAAAESAAAEAAVAAERDGTTPPPQGLGAHSHNPWTGHPLLRPPTGILLYGPPGCGKTMLIRAAAREAGVNLLQITPGVIESKWFGESAQNVRALFGLARKLQPCLVYIDEVDALCLERHQESNSRDLKAELLQQWDGLRGVRGDRIIILGSTNSLQDLDEAFQRRFVRSIQVPYPSYNERVQVLRKVMEGVALDPKLSLPTVAAATDGYSASDLEELARAALHRPVREMRARLRLRARSATNSSGTGVPPDGASVVGPIEALRPLTIGDLEAAMEEALPTKFHGYERMTRSPPPARVTENLGDDSDADNWDDGFEEPPPRGNANGDDAVEEARRQGDVYTGPTSFPFS
uniref:AAA+ ATPase domain-containing protein n=1 Tax=Phaeomonas parva TaxID=124430 RepID=A0A6U4IE80_9STRA